MAGAFGLAQRCVAVCRVGIADGAPLREPAAVEYVDDDHLSAAVDTPLPVDHRSSLSRRGTTSVVLDSNGRTLPLVPVLVYKRRNDGPDYDIAGNRGWERSARLHAYRLDDQKDGSLKLRSVDRNQRTLGLDRRSG